MIPIMTKNSSWRLATIRDLYKHLACFAMEEDDVELLIIRGLAESSRDDNKRRPAYRELCEELMREIDVIMAAGPFGDERDNMRSFDILYSRIGLLDAAAF
jgi:hypothetical protein